MQPSRNNITGRIHDSESRFVVNLLSQNADITDEAHLQLIASGVPDPQVVSRGYVVDPVCEERDQRAAYFDFLDKRDSDEVQIFYVPWYSCNFSCGYCYQAVDEYRVQSTDGTNEENGDTILRAFFLYVDAAFANRKKYLTLFGGEPLLPGKSAQNTISFFLEQAFVRELDVAIVTNGYTLTEYIPVLSQAKIREIQVTLDGLPEIHDKRRPHRGGGKTFDRVVSGIDAALSAGMPINLRVVIDRENLGELHRLARFAVQKGWTKNPLFKTQLGRSYELHSCMKNSDRLYTRISMYQELYEEIRKHPEILDFHRPAYSISRFLFENEDLPDPLFDSCPATKTEWAFDFTGKIFSCTATVGKQGEALGTFYPEVRLNDVEIQTWQNRDVVFIRECRDCPAALACGGGCAAVAKNRTGNLCSTDCRPVKELIALGFALYGGTMSEIIREINAQEFETVVIEHGKVAVDFYSTECPPCEAFAGKYEKAAGLFGEDVRFVKIFRQGNRELAEKLEVKSSPTVLFFKNGELQAARLSGAIRQSELESGLAEMVGDARAEELTQRRKKYSTETDVVILGGGPAGLAAGIYLSQAKLATIIVDTALPGGYVATTHEVSNYPGFSDPQAGYMLSHQMSEQARRAGVLFRGAAELKSADLEARRIELSDGETISARWVVIATGSSPKRLGVRGELEFSGKGISYCATCDAKYYQDKDVVVIGGGNSAVEESLFISRFARSVTIIHQFDGLTANREAQEKARANEKIKFLLEHEPRGFEKNSEGMMVVEVENLKSGIRKKINTDGVFIYAGFSPNTSLFKGRPAGRSANVFAADLVYDQWGNIITDQDMRTTMPGVFAVGDIRSKKHRQITTAVSDGTIAAIEITKESEART